MRLTWPRGRGGSVQGFPRGHYGPRALDERMRLELEVLERALQRERQIRIETEDPNAPEKPAP